MDNSTRSVLPCVVFLINFGLNANRGFDRKNSTELINGVDVWVSRIVFGTWQT